jgi:LysM repeat protein
VPRFAAALEAYRQVDVETQGLSIVMVPQSLDLRILAVETGIPVDTMYYYNRCYLREVTPPEGGEWELIVPSDRSSLVFETAWTMDRSRYLVRYGDTWAGLASSFGTGVDDLKAANPGSALTAGDWLVLPESDRSPVNAAASDRAGYFQYTVRSGDTLSEIAATVGVSSREVAVWNDMSPGETIYPGQVLQLRGTPGEEQVETAVEIVTGGGRITHTVVEGDTLWDLSISYNVSVEQIMQLNSMENSVLSIGQVLVIRPE